MKIAFIVGHHIYNSIGGSEVQASYILEYLKKKGHNIFYICYGKQSNIKSVYKEKNFRIYNISKPWKGIKQSQYFKKRILWKILDFENPDLIYQRGDFHFSDLVSRYGKSRDIPVISAITMERHCQPIKIRKNHMIIFDVLDKFLIKSYFNKSTKIIAQTTHQKKQLKKNYNLNSIVIPNAHPIPNIKEKRGNGFKIIWVANIKPIKRPLKFIELANKLSDTNIKFYMVGKLGKRNLQSKMNENLKNNKNINYLGYKNIDETNRLISESKILVNTSESEGFSNTFIQAWLRGTVVISMNTDPEDLIKNKSLGYIAPNIDEMEKTIRRLLNNPYEMKKVRKYSMEYAMKHFDIEVVGKKYLKMFNKLKM